MAILIHNCTAVLMDEGGTVLPGAYVTVEGTQITSVGTVRPQGNFDEEIDGGGNVLMPGFVNAHTHVPMTLMRGYGGGCDLHTWLHQYIFPTEAKWDDRAIRAATALGLAEMIASGVTCIADMYMNNEAIIQEVLSAGISANICCGATQFTDGFDPETHHDCVVQRQLTERWHGAGEGQIAIDGSIHGEYTSHAPLWEWMARYAADHGLGMHVHLSETKSEHDGCVAGHRRPLCLDHAGRLGHPGQKRGQRRHQPHVQPEAGLRHRPAEGTAAGRGQRGPGHRRGVLQQFHRPVRRHEAGGHPHLRRRA